MKDKELRRGYCTFYIIRHGETEWNVRKIMQGQKDSPLTDRGIIQAKDIAKKLEKISFNAVFSSDLLRAKRTAEIIAAEKKLAIATTRLLRERAFGKYEGKPFDIYNKKIEKALIEYKSVTKKELFRYKLDEDVESDEEIISRLITFIREIAVGFARKTVLLVTHGGIMRAFLIHLGYGTMEELPSGSVRNTAYVKLLSDGVDFIIKEAVGVEKKIIKVEKP